MAKVKIQGHASGTGVLTVTAPNTSTDRTITLPDSTGTLLTLDGDGSSLTGISSGPFTEVSTHKFTYTTATNPMIQVIDSTNTVKAQMQGGDTSAVFGSASDHPVDFIQGAGEATRMRITTTGRVGIGDTTPSAKLEVEAGSETAFTARATVSGEYGAIFQSASTNTTPIADFRSNGGTSRLKVMSDGRARSPFTAASWCNVNMSSGAFNDHHNHDSLTDVGTGAFVISFTVNMNDSSYSVVGCNQDGYLCGYTNKAQDSFRGYSGDSNWTKVDLASVCFAVFGN